MRGLDRTELHKAPGGIDSLRSPLLGPSTGLAPSGPTQALFKNAPGVFVRAACSLRSQSVQLAVASCRTPVGCSHPPRRRATCEKKPVLSYELFLEYGGEGGIDSLRPPFGQPVRYALSLSNWLSPVVEPRSGVLIPPAGVQHAKKKPVLSYELFLEYGGEGGIRTPDTLPYTHFPGVLLQPLGHLTILFAA